MLSLRSGCPLALRARPYWLLVCLIGPCTQAMASDRDADMLPPERFPAVESYGLDQGLAQSSVISLVEDASGFLWFGTQEGLHRFDGHRFDVLRRKPGEPGSLISSTIDVLEVDQHERLWLGSNDAGVEIIDLASLKRWRFAPEDGLSHSRIISLRLSASGQSALVATAGGVDRIRLGEGRVDNLLERSDLIGLVSLKDDSWLAADRHCNLVFSDGHEFRPGSAEDATCVALRQAPDETAWLATRQGELIHIEPGAASEVSMHERPDELNGHLSALFVEDDGRFLIGDSEGGVVEWHPSQPNRYSRWRIDIGSSAVLTFYRDSFDVLWIGTYTDGLHRVLPMSETVLAGGKTTAFDPVPWPSTSVRAIRYDRDRRLVGTDNGLFSQSPGEAGWRQLDELDGVPVRVIIHDESGSAYWLGTHQGLWRWQPPDSPRQVAAAALPDQRITDLIDHDGEVWVATRSGLAVFAEGRVQPDEIPERLRRRFLTTLALDDNGDLWVGSNEDGVFRFAPGEPAEPVYSGNPEYASESVWAIHVDARHIWLGTFGGGLVKLDRDGNVLHRITESDGMPNNVVYRILPDDDDRLWLSTNNGLAVLDTNDMQVQQLGRRDGLTNQEFNAGAAWKDEEGVLYFGGVDGVDSIDSSAFRFDSPPARPVVTGLTVTHRNIGLLQQFDGLDASLPYADEIRLNHKQRIFSLRMVALDFNAPSAARLRYRVDGLHDDWVQVNGAQTEFSINYLAPGNYPLIIEAAGRDGRFANRHELKMVLAPPPWRHPVAYALYSLLILFLLALIAWQVRRNIHAKRRQVDILHHQVDRRTAELQKLNRELHRSNLKLDRATRRDPLTGLSNRRDFLDWVEKQQDRLAKGSDSRLLFLMIDVDDFKQINDHHGHAVGDQVLVAFSQRLRSFCREQDILVRWGGEEFLMVVDHIDPSMGKDLSDRICRAVAETTLLKTRELALRVTCSIGFAPWPVIKSADTINSWELSADLADRALYKAKTAGKNGWCGLYAGDRARGDRPDEFSPDKTLSELVEQDTLRVVASSSSGE